jgi:hypothetical protein
MIRLASSTCRSAGRQDKGVVSFGTEASVGGDWLPPASVIRSQPSRVLGAWLQVLSVIGAGTVVLTAASSWWAALAPRSRRFSDVNVSSWVTADWAYVGAQ